MSFVLGGLSTTQHYPVVLGREKGEKEEGRTGGREEGRRGVLSALAGVLKDLCTSLASSHLCPDSHSEKVRSASQKCHKEVLRMLQYRVSGGQGRWL